MTNGTPLHSSHAPWQTPNSTMTYRSSLPLCMLWQNGAPTSLIPAKHLKSGQITKICLNLGKHRILTANRHVGTWNCKILTIHSIKSLGCWIPKLTSYPDYPGIRDTLLRRWPSPCCQINALSTKWDQKLYCSRRNNSVREVHCQLVQSNQLTSSQIFKIRSKMIIEERH